MLHNLQFGCWEDKGKHEFGPEVQSLPSVFLLYLDTSMDGSKQNKQINQKIQHLPTLHHEGKQRRAKTDLNFSPQERRKSIYTAAPRRGSTLLSCPQRRRTPRHAASTRAVRVPTEKAVSASNARPGRPEPPASANSALRSKTRCWETAPQTGTK